MIMPVISVEDVDRSLAFYKKLGFEESMALPGPDGVNAFAIVNLGQASLGLGLDEHAGQGKGVDFMVYVPDEVDLDEHHKQVSARGVEVGEIKTQYWGDRIFVVFDPDGYRITLCKTVHQPDMEHLAGIMRGDIDPDAQ